MFCLFTFQLEPNQLKIRLYGYIRYTKLAYFMYIYIFYVYIQIIPKECPDCKPREFIYSLTQLSYSSVILGKKFSETLSCLPAKWEWSYSSRKSSYYCKFPKYYSNMVGISMHIMVYFNVIYVSISYLRGLVEHFYFSNIFYC